MGHVALAWVKLGYSSYGNAPLRAHNEYMAARKKARSKRAPSGDDREELLHDALAAALDAKTIHDILKTLAEAGAKGDVQASKLALEYAIGRAGDRGVSEEVEQLRERLRLALDTCIRYAIHDELGLDTLATAALTTGDGDQADVAAAMIHKIHSDGIEKGNPYMALQWRLMVGLRYAYERLPEPGMAHRLAWLLGCADKAPKSESWGVQQRRLRVLLHDDPDHAKARSLLAELSREHTPDDAGTAPD